MTNLKILIILVLFLLGAVTLNAVTYEQLPHWPSRRGFHYCLDMANYKQLLEENMPHQVQRGYILVDSLDKVMPNSSWTIVEKMNLQSDTAQYIQKYWCYMNDYDPVRFYWLLCKKNPETKNNFSSAKSKLRKKMEWDDKFNYVYPSYILHIYVNKRMWIDTSNTKDPDYSSATVAYCKVLDTLKGKVFPSFADAIIYNGDLSEELRANYTAVPPQTDVVFSYRHGWANGHWRTPIGWHWIKSEREYIVFLEFRGIDAIGSWDPVGSVHKEYYSLMPYQSENSCSMYPIEDGYVLDAKNALGFGEKVPVDIFKQNIRNKINEIKNYGGQ